MLALTTQRNELARTGLFLQNCWLVQVKPGGTARTSAKYWQVRSRQPIFDGKTLKHLKPEEVDEYRVAIAQGRELKAIDRKIAGVQKQIAELTSSILSQRSSDSSAPQSSVSQSLVKELIANSQALRESLQQRAAQNQQLRAGAMHLGANLHRIIESR